MQPEFQRIEQQLLAIAKDTAITRFTEDKVTEAAAYADGDMTAPATYVDTINDGTGFSDAGKLVSALEGYTTLNYENFTGLTDGTFTAEFPSCFTLAGSVPSNNAWSVLEDIYQTPNPPQWNAIVAFNN